MGGYRGLLICLIASAFLAYKYCHAAGVNVCGNTDQIPCDNSQCIPRNNWCDKEIDCADGSDEQYCKTQGLRWWGPVPDNHCTDKHFVCDDGMCVPAVVRCDGIDDCSDWTDEENCEGTSSQRSSVTKDASREEIQHDNTTDSVETYDTHGYGRPSRKPTSTTRPTNSPRIPSTTSFYEKRNKEESVEPNHRYPYYEDRNGPPNRYDHPGRYDQNRHGYQDRNGQQNSYDYQNRDGRYNTQDPYRNRGSDSSRNQYPPANEQSTSQYPPRTTGVTPHVDRSRVGYDSSRADRDMQVQRQHLVHIQPRVVIRPPHPRQLHYTRNKVHPSALPPFYFAKNYTEQIRYRYENNVKNATQWLIHRRNSSYNWGDDTPRALVALSLINNSFTSDIVENDLMKKALQIHLGLKLLRSRTQPLLITRYALYINALLATCQNPRDFLDHDLVEALYRKRFDIRSHSQRTVLPFVYLTLCLSNRALNLNDIHLLESLILREFHDEVGKDRHILATTALACVLKQDYSHDYEIQSQLYRIEAKVDEAIRTLLQYQKSDGSFGSIYSTAIAAQALMSVNSSTWDQWPTLDFLARHQLEDGSFGDMLSTYYILPVLRGRSLLHLRNTKCGRTAVGNRTLSDTLTPEEILNLPGPRKTVFYSVAIGYPERFSFSMQLNLAESVRLFDAMRVAEFLDLRFRFSYKLSPLGREVYSISGLPNDPERKYYWNLYLLRPTDSQVDITQRYMGDLDEIVPVDGQEFLFWYLQTD